MPNARDSAAADAFVNRWRSTGDLAATVGTTAVAEGHLRDLMRLAFLQGWHEAMVARDGDEDRDPPEPLTLPMTKHLERAFAKAAKLPKREQVALAEWILLELEDARRWAQAFRVGRKRLGALADEALTELRAGRTRPLDPSKLGRARTHRRRRA